MWTQSRLRLAFAPSLDLIPCLQDSKWANFKAVCWTLLYWSLQFYTMEPCSTFHQYSSDMDLVELAFFAPFVKYLDLSLCLQDSSNVEPISDRFLILGMVAPQLYIQYQANRTNCLPKNMMESFISY